MVFSRGTMARSDEPLPRSTSNDVVPCTMSTDPARTAPESSGALPPGDPDAALQLLEEWLADESGYDEETWPELKAALDRNRPPGARKLFVDE